MLWKILGIVLVYLAGEACTAAQLPVVTFIADEGFSHPKKAFPKKKHHKKKHKPKRRHKKPQHYSAQKIEKMLNDDPKDGLCNRLNCSSKLDVAKKCLKSRHDHRKHKECFHAFCQYGCNEEDYTTRYDVFEFCNKTCSSKKYSKRSKSF